MRNLIKDILYHNLNSNISNDANTLGPRIMNIPDISGFKHSQ